jgi:hypothetical protein
MAAFRDTNAHYSVPNYDFTSNYQYLPKLVQSLAQKRGRMENRGGVGLVFVNDEGGSMFLHVARVVPVLHLFIQLLCLVAVPTFPLVQAESNT